jgi:hypothetical protein
MHPAPESFSKFEQIIFFSFDLVLLDSDLDPDIPE